MKNQKKSPEKKAAERLSCPFQGIEKKYSKKEMIFLQGDELDHLFFIQSGRIRVFWSDPEGKEFSIEIMGPGRIFGEASLQRSGKCLTSACAEAEVSLVSFSISEMKAKMKESDSSMNLVLDAFTHTTHSLIGMLRRLTLATAREKIADFLLEATGIDAPELGLSLNYLNYTHEEIAECTHLQRVSVSRVLKELESDGIILLGYHSVEVLDRSRLESIIF